MAVGDLQSKYDFAQLFSAYVAFAGDLRKAAAVCNVPYSVAQAAAEREHWQQKLPDFALAGPSGAPGSLELQQQINRAVNYIQAHRLRSIIDRVVTRLAAMDTDQLIELLTRTTRAGAEFTARPLTDLVKAAEACQNMTMRALGDSSTNPDESSSGSKVGLLVMRAMDAADQVGISSVDIVRAEFSPAKAAPPRISDTSEKAPHEGG